MLFLLRKEKKRKAKERIENEMKSKERKGKKRQETTTKENKRKGQKRKEKWSLELFGNKEMWESGYPIGILSLMGSDTWVVNFVMDVTSG